MTYAALFSQHAASAAFDRIADAYDASFSESLIGKAQRKVIWRALEKAFRPGDRILELNCGTGEDAFFLAKRGISVLACDASARMIAVAQKRKSREAPGSPLQFRVLRNEDIGFLTPAAEFDGALSNFSGLNCVEDVSQVARKLSQLLKPGAAALICLSTRVCLWEIAWYGRRGNFKKAFRRVRGATVARLNGIAVPVWYPTIASVRRSFEPFFTMSSIRAVGLFVPPSYLEAWAEQHLSALKSFEAMDRICGSWPLLRGIGDHVLLEFVRGPEVPERLERHALQPCPVSAS
jgi:ubiquinone/menaquinone biosynthesis C-methylase UbiE